jgi:hypothetical protein
MLECREPVKKASLEDRFLPCTFLFRQYFNRLTCCCKKKSLKELDQFDRKFTKVTSLTHMAKSVQRLNLHLQAELNLPQNMLSKFNTETVIASEDLTESSDKLSDYFDEQKDPKAVVKN